MTQPAIDIDNPHTTAALESLGWAERHPDDKEQAGSRATTHAALAAAYEQRTANLLAYLAYLAKQPAEDQHEAPAILNMIRERLSLNLPS
ncbi:hypothetical protein [Arthrobacter pigmenti]